MNLPGLDGGAAQYRFSRLRMIGCAWHKLQSKMDDAFLSLKET
jgi:hypothetical protein